MERFLPLQVEVSGRLGNLAFAGGEIRWRVAISG